VHQYRNHGTDRTGCQATGDSHVEVMIVVSWDGEVPHPAVRVGGDGAPVGVGSGGAARGAQRFALAQRCGLDSLAGRRVPEQVVAGGVDDFGAGAGLEGLQVSLAASSKLAKADATAGRRSEAISLGIRPTATSPPPPSPQENAMTTDHLSSALRACALRPTHSKQAPSCSSATRPSCTATTSPAGSSPAAPTGAPRWPPSTGTPPPPPLPAAASLAPP
jgi:hypothetical protein